MMQDYQSAFNYIAALTQSDPNAVIVDFRCIHDVDKARAAIPRRGTLPQLWNELVTWNNAGYGVFVNINEMDGSGQYWLANVSVIRCQVTDLDNLSAEQNYQQATQFTPRPSFACQTSPGKFHVYWSTTRHTDKDRFTLIQRKLRQLFDGDKSVIDASRVLRLPGTLHLKNPQQPFVVTCWALDGYGQVNDPAFLEAALANVNVIDGAGGRKDLGDPSLAAPSFDWCREALRHIDPNTLDRGEWISFTAAFKQAGWTHASEETLFNMWAQWCARYAANDPQENSKNWNSIRNSEVGWPSIERRIPAIHAMRIFSDKTGAGGAPQPPQPATPEPSPLPPPNPMPAPRTPDIPTSEFLTDEEQKKYFDGCVFIERMGEILTPSGRFMNTTQFNGTYGGKIFVVDRQGKTSTEAWAAATRSSLWTIPKADHVRFVPQAKPGEMIFDALGRKGVNTYRPIIINQTPGDVMPFINHVARILPVEGDRRILFDYMAHNARFPGYKIPWAPLIQSVEGVGKGVLKSVMQHVMGAPYFYTPRPEELVNSGSKFNSWMRARLFILVDEIKVDERRDMIEVLKPMISEKQIEIQAKGIDQDVEDNFANWMFLSNYKDAIPVNKNARRFSIFYSQIQTKEDLIKMKMGDAYFAWLFDWLDNQNGNAIIAHWLMNYPIDRGTIPMRAPDTSSSHEALKHSRGPVEQAIVDAVEDNAPGFRGGWISSIAVANRLKANGVRSITHRTLNAIMETMGYYHIGRAHRAYIHESPITRAHLYSTDQAAQIATFGPWQGYET